MSGLFPRLDRIRVIMPQPPFSHLSGIVSFLFQQRGQCQSPFLNISISELRSIVHTPFPPAPRIPARQQSVPCGRANRRRCVRIRKANPLIGDAVDVGCLDGGFRIITTGVAPAKIIREDDDNIRTWNLGRLSPFSLRIGRLMRRRLHRNQRDYNRASRQESLKSRTAHGGCILSCCFTLPVLCDSCEIGL